MYNIIKRKWGKIILFKLGEIVLAFVGDAVYSLFVRERLTFNSDYKSGQLNKLATSQVNAVAQSEFVKAIIPLFTDD